MRRATEEERSNEGQEAEGKEGLIRAGSGPGRNNIRSRSCLNVFARYYQVKMVISSNMKLQKFPKSAISSGLVQNFRSSILSHKPGK